MKTLCKQAMRSFIAITILLTYSVVSCRKSKPQHAEDNPIVPVAQKYAAYITKNDAYKHLSIISSDDFEGRKTGLPGAKKAADYIAEEFKKMRLIAPVSGSYFQLVSERPSRSNPDRMTSMRHLNAYNVMGYLEGTDLKDEVLVFSAHYDHLNYDYLNDNTDGADKTDNIYNGADDNGSGITAILELAKAYTQAKKDGKGPRRSILFLTLVGEEQGLWGSNWYVTDPVFPLKNTIANLNIDMLGRVDPSRKKNPNYCYLIGSDRLSTDLHKISEQANATYTKLDIDYKHNDPNDDLKLYERSDHYNFAKHNIPIIFYTSGPHDDYHKPSDEISKIRFDLLVKRTQLIFYTGWELTNRDKRPILDVIPKE